MRIVSLFAGGVIFGLGLLISGMANPAKVLNFLDVAGSWDPSLLFVMASAVTLTALGFWLVRLRDKPLYEDKFQIPVSQLIDGRLMLGAAIFGAGWGLAGFCPGPAMTGILLGNTGTLIFVVAMLAGMGLGRFITR